MTPDEIFAEAARLRREFPSQWKKRVRNLLGDMLLTPDGGFAPIRFVALGFDEGTPRTPRTPASPETEDRILRAMLAAGYRAVVFGDQDYDELTRRYLDYHRSLGLPIPDDWRVTRQRYVDGGNYRFIVPQSWA